MGFRSLPPVFKVRERADPKGHRGVGVAKNRTAQLCTAAPPAPCGSIRRLPRTCRTRPPRPRTHEQPRSRGPIGRPPRLWNLTGHGKLRTTGHPPPDLPTPVGNPSPQSTTRDSHRYTQPRRGGDRHWTTTRRAAQSIPCYHTHALGGTTWPPPAPRSGEVGEWTAAPWTTRPVTAPKLRPLPPPARPVLRPPAPCPFPARPKTI
jgi:hypothetical protein